MKSLRVLPILFGSRIAEIPDKALLVSHPPPIKLDVLRSGLEKAGLNMCSVFSASQVSDCWVDPIGWQNLLLIGNTGRQMWDAMPPGYFDRDHPVDEYSSDVVSRLLSDQLSPQHWQLLFPADTELKLPLQDLGARAGWHHPSPLGIGINHVNGLWFAYRAVVTLDVGLIGSQPKVTEIANAESPCISCEGAPCVTACPANALVPFESPNLRSCVSHRVSQDSTCASTCVARLACPVATEYQYAEDQIAYYYDRSLASAKLWVTAG